MGTYYITIPVAIIAVPLLWKISLAAAVIGATICTVSLITNLMKHYYQKHLRKKAAAGDQESTGFVLSTINRS